MTLDWLPFLIALVAMIYASVGHGGASGYLAVLALAGYEPSHMSSSALMLNVLVAGTAWWAFWRAGHGSWRLSWPFMVTSIPAAWLGGWIAVSPQLYHGLLAVALLCAAARLCLPMLETSAAVYASPRSALALPVGAGVGLASGIVGVGGGIFLSPLMVLCRWADPKRAAAASAGFIVMNSAAGLTGRLFAGRIELGVMTPLVAAAFIGGLIGSQWGANRLSHPRLRHILALVLVVAATQWLLP